MRNGWIGLMGVVLVAGSSSAQSITIEQITEAPFAQALAVGAEPSPGFTTPAEFGTSGLRAGLTSRVGS